MMNGIGNIDKVWIGYATDQAIRLNAASGGIITGSLIGLLRDKIIDGAVVNVPDEDHPLQGKSILAKTEAEILHSAKSVFCVTEIQRGLDMIKSERVAVVGLPCQITDLRKRMSKDSVLSEKVVVCFGLMCGHNVLPGASFEAIRRLGIDAEEIKEFRYRASGWFPYNASLKMKNGDVIDIPWLESPFKDIWDSYNYQSKRCLECSDFAAEEADIACCDAWLEEFRGNQEGYSIVLTHTKKGSGFIERLIKRDVLTLKVDDVSCLQRSNSSQIDRKLKRKHV